MIRARLSIDRLDGTAAAFVIDGNQFGFEGAHRKMFVNGPRFGKSRPIGEPTDFFEPGKPFELEVRRAGATLSFGIDGKRVWSTPFPAGEIGSFGLRPWRATMRIRDFAAEGTLIAARLPNAPKPPRPPRIPLIDLSAETNRQVIVAAGTETDYRGQVDTVLMGDGRTMFATWSIGHGGRCGPLKKSVDGGLTWSGFIGTPPNWGEVSSCPCIFRLTDPAGVERLFVFAGRPKHFGAVSEDGGATWTPMKETGLYKPGGNTAIIPIENGRAHLLLMQRGPAGAPTNEKTQAVWQAVSRDGGLSWGDYRKVCEVPGAVPCEPEVLRSPDGRQLACLMRENSRRLNSLAMFSDDEGGTWTKAREAPPELTGDRHVARFAPDGRLVVAFRDRAVGSPTYGHYVAWVGTYDDLREGRPGQYRVKLLHSHAGPDCGYSGLECLPDGTMVATTYIKYRPGKEKHSIVSVRFRLEEMDAAFERGLLGCSDERFELLEEGRQAGLIEVAPVHLPYCPEGENDHFGWPVATMIDDTLIVVHRAMPGHNRKLSGAADEDTTYSMVVRSTDGGKAWSEPADLRDCMRLEDRDRGGSVPLSHRYKFDPENTSPLGYKLHLNAIGTTREGAVVVAGDHGVFRSEDKGKTWRHLRTAFREDRHQGPFVYVGPRLIDDPEQGLLLFAHHTLFRNGRPHDIAPELAVYRSRDGGASWTGRTLNLPEWCKPAEPDVMVHDGRFVAILRNQAPANVLAQARFDFEDRAIVEIANTPMKTKVSVDTSAICFNPVTRRYEVIQSRREDMSIHLFSLAPEDWASAGWRHEGILFKRGGRFYRDADGFHTGGAVIDGKRGVQHVFFYSGAPGGPAGVFRFTRTLDTPTLAAFLKGRRP